jgi:hypothetical protein
MVTLALPDLQAAFRAHVLGEDRAELLDTVSGGTLLPAGRLAIYRNHVRLSLTAALAATFPVVARLVGEAFFAGLAGGYLRSRPPAGPVLAEYGAGFADHIAAEPAASGLSYLADVARLEWALNLAWQAAPGPALRPDELGRLAVADPRAVTIALQPGTTLLQSRWPIDLIWRANQPGSGEPDVALDGGGVALLVFRGADDAGFVVLGAQDSRFIAALVSGASLQAAADAGFSNGEGSALADCLGRLLGAGVLAAITQLGPTA